MTQDETQSLLLYLVDELRDFQKIRFYLQIAIEQLDNPNKDTFSRIELLINAYISESDRILDESDGLIRKLRKLSKAGLKSD